MSQIKYEDKPIEIIHGDLFTTDCEIIAHSVNCQGVMGKGIAFQLKQKYHKAFDSYTKLCYNAPVKSNLLGSIQAIRCNEKIIVNMFTQDRYGCDRRYTDYNAMHSCFKQLTEIRKPHQKIAMPYRLGCGLGGGDWNRVYNLMVDFFSGGELVLYRLDD
jgi:O-acetyl-ADP-ribose deacetylase (regulator of RNase III)